MSATIRKKRWAAVASGAALLLAAWTVSPAAGQTPSFITGHVKTAGTAGRPLSERLDQARGAAQGGSYFAAYLFESRNRFHSRGAGRIIETYDVGTTGTKIHIRSKNDRGDENVTTNEDKAVPSPAGLLLFCDKSGSIVDVSILDPEQTYEFDGTPVYWLGTASNEESMAVIETAFARAADKHLKSGLVFAAACHTGPRGYAFVKGVAMGSEDSKVRENAVFWLGNYGDARSLADLKEIFRAEKNGSVKKQIVFAMQLNKSREATAELIAVAKSDPDREIRKTAIFWLGQKASVESVKALKDIVDAKDDATGLKEQAVFAISQLPKDRSVPMLIDIAKTNASPSVRKKAIFWLGQTGDEAALKFFEDILLKK